MTMIAYAFLQHHRLATARRGEKELMDRHHSQAYPPCVVLSSLTSLARGLRAVRTLWPDLLPFTPCISKPSRTGTRRPPSCCARATATKARSANAPCATSPTGPPLTSKACAACSRAAPSFPAEQDAFTVTRSLPHGHVAAALGTARKIGLDRILGPDGNRCRDLVLALLIGRILDPVSKLAAARTLSPATASSSLGEALGLGEVDDDELYAALDWLLARQSAIETALARRHLQNGTLVLYDVSSSYMEGRCCPLAKRGYSRDGKKGTLANRLWPALRA